MYMDVLMSRQNRRERFWATPKALARQIVRTDDLDAKAKRRRPEGVEKASLDFFLSLIFRRKIGRPQVARRVAHREVRHQLQWFQHDMGRSIPEGMFVAVNDPAPAIDTEAFGGDWPACLQ